MTARIRPTKIKRGYTRMSPGSVLIESGNTRVLCTASVEPKVPDWLKGKGKGWITAEYNMLPHSTSPRKARERLGRMPTATQTAPRAAASAAAPAPRLEPLPNRPPPERLPQASPRRRWPR